MVKSETDIIRMAIKDFIKKHKRKLNKSNIELIDEYNRKKKLTEESMKAKEKARCYFLIKNGYKRIIELAMISKFNTGEINMSIVDDVVNSHLKIFKLFPDSIQKRMKKDIETFKELKNPEFLSSQMSKIKLIRLLK